jgi:hypothetical protein
MHHLLCVALVLGVASAIPWNAAVKSKTPQDGCCMKAQAWQFQISEMHSSTDTTDPQANSFHMLYVQTDSKSLRTYQSIAIVPTSGAGFNAEIWIAPGSSSGNFIQYWRTTRAEEYCFYANVTDQGWFSLPCFQAPMIYVGDVMFGSSLKTQIWQYNTGIRNSSYCVQMDQCLPVAGYQTAYDDHYFEQNLNDFYNEKFSVDDPSKFTPPTNCRPAPPPSAANHEEIMSVPKLFPAKPFVFA